MSVKDVVAMFLQNPFGQKTLTIHDRVLICLWEYVLTNLLKFYTQALLFHMISLFTLLQDIFQRNKI